jgi:ribosomal protein L11 methyltransferase
MDQSYLEIDILIPSEFQEILISELMDLDFDGFEQFDNHLLAFIPKSRYNDVSREFIESWTAVQQFKCELRGEREYEPQNWNEQWEKTIQPMRIGEFFVRPTWTPEPTPQGFTLLEIDPKMAFGTGYHETTRLMLQMISKVIRSGDTVLDVGTGTGILAIAALKLNAAHAFGFDIDEWSYVNATENALLNEIDDRFEVAEGSFDTIPQNATYRVVLANVNRNMLLATSAQIVKYLQSGGELLLSGLLDVDEQIILENNEYASLEFVEKLQENEWICLRFRNK